MHIQENIVPLDIRVYGVSALARMPVFTTGQKTNCCSTCYLLSRGHIGLQGKNCNMQDKPDNGQTIHYTTLLHVAAAALRDTNVDNTNTRDNALMELANQIGQLTLNMQHMQHDIHEMKSSRMVSAMAAAPASMPCKMADDTSKLSAMHMNVCHHIIYNVHTDGGF